MALIAVAVAISAGLGSRWNWWSFGTGFSLLRWAFFGSIAAALLSLGGALANSSNRGRLSALLGLFISLPVIILPLMWINQARSVPAIHDITTDTMNPPRFQALLPLRNNATNSAQYDGPEVAALQRKAYPDIQPIMLKAAPHAVFATALATAHDLGWNVVAQDPAQGRIEATDTTLWFGFTDDIAIRIKPDNGGSRLDIRSKSRVGRSDVGTNAARIRKFTKVLLQHFN